MPKTAPRFRFCRGSAPGVAGRVEVSVRFTDHREPDGRAFAEPEPDGGFHVLREENWICVGLRERTLHHNATILATTTNVKR